MKSRVFVVLVLASMAGCSTPKQKCELSQQLADGFATCMTDPTCHMTSTNYHSMELAKQGRLRYCTAARCTISDDDGWRVSFPVSSEKECDRIKKARQRP